MIKITNETLDTAAENYAAEALGEEQFKSNADAVFAISGDFKSGARYILDLLKSDLEFIDETEYNNG